MQSGRAALKLHPGYSHRPRQRQWIIRRTTDNLNLSPQSVNRSIDSKCRHLEDREKDVILERAVPTVLIG